MPALCSDDGRQLVERIRAHMRRRNLTSDRPILINPGQGTTGTRTLSRFLSDGFAMRVAAPATTRDDVRERLAFSDALLYSAQAALARCLVSAPRYLELRVTRGELCNASARAAVAAFLRPSGWRPVRDLSEYQVYGCGGSRAGPSGSGRVADERGDSPRRGHGGGATGTSGVHRSRRRGRP